MIRVGRTALRLLLVAGAARGELGQVHTPSLGAIAAIAYLVVFGSLVACRR